MFFSNFTLAITRLQDLLGARAVIPPPPQPMGDYDTRDYDARDYYAR